MDESYTVTVTSAGVASILAPTQWGALRGLETFSQLVVWEAEAFEEGAFYSLHNTSLVVKDTPRFPWRGFLFDTARHFWPVPAILAHLDAMSYNKLNVLHWHIMDTNSWPLQSTRYPAFSEKGAFAKQAVYTHADVAAVVAHAWERGIMVLPEWDMPAHASIWGVAYPNLTITCPPTVRGETLLTPTGEALEVFAGLLEEFLPLFNTTQYVHIGGDEVWTYACWEDSPRVAAWMASKGYTTMAQVRDDFEATAQRIVAESGKHALVWEEVFDGGYTVDNTTIVNVWKGATTVQAAAAAGFATITSWSWYIDFQVPAFGPTHLLWEDTWMNYYLNDPLANTTLTPAQEGNVWGGEAAMWGETVDQWNFAPRAWPRSAAIAERLWSPRAVNDTSEALGRLARQRCRMVQRGIPAAPLRPADEVGYCPVPGLA